MCGSQPHPLSGKGLARERMRAWQGCTSELECRHRRPMCPELSVDGFSFEKGIHSEKKKKKLESISCLMFEGPNDAFFSSKEFHSECTVKPVERTAMMKLLAILLESQNLVILSLPSQGSSDAIVRGRDVREGLFLSIPCFRGGPYHLLRRRRRKKRRRGKLPHHQIHFNR